MKNNIIFHINKGFNKKLPIKFAEKLNKKVNFSHQKNKNKKINI